MNPHLKGLLITAFGILALSPDSLIIRLIEADPGVNQWTILFWRGFFVFEGMLLVAAIQYGRGTVQAFRDIGWPGVSATLLWSCSTLLFISALHHTSVANTLVIISTSPIFAALLGRVVLGERIALHTTIAIVVVIAAMLLIVAESYQGGAWFGDLSALGVAICVAGTFISTRKKRDRDMAPAVALSGLLVAAVSLPLAAPFAVSAQTAWLFLLLGLLLTVSLKMLFVGPRYISAAEVSLLLPLETVFGTLLVWWVLGERPVGATLLGGGIVVLVLFIHAGIGQWRLRAS